MGFWQKHPLRFKYLFLAISIFFLVLIAKNFYEIATTFDDQNAYVDPPTRLYIQKPLLITPKNNTNFEDNILPPGSFILSLNGKILSTEVQVYRYLDEYRDTEFIDLEIFRLTPNDSAIGFRDTVTLQRRTIPNDFFSYLHSCVVVYDVEKDGVSDIAGLKTGDLIVKINDRYFRSGEEAHRMVANNRSGNNVYYTILRSGEQLDIKIELAKFKMPLDYLLVFIFGLLIIITGVWIGFMRPGIFSARLIGTGLVLFGISLSLLSYGEFALLLLEFLGLVNIYITRISLILAIPLLMHSLVYFPFERKRLIEKFIYLKIPYIIAIVFSFINLVEIIATVNLFGGILVSFGFIFFALWYPLIFIIFRDRNEKKYGGKTISISYLIVLLFMVLQVILANNSITLPSFFNLIYLIIPFAYIFTIAKYALLDELIKLTKNIQYSILSVILNILVYILILLSVIWFAELEIPIPNIHFNGSTIKVLDNPLSDRSQELYEKILLIIFGGIIALVLLSVKRKILKKLNDYFYIVDINYEEALNRLNEVIQKQLSFSDLAESISKKLVEVIKIKRAGVIFFDENKRVLSQYYYGINDKKLSEFTISIENELVDAIDEFSGNILIDYLKPNVKKIYLECNFKNLIQIRAQSKLLGVLLIGEKKSEARHKTEDLAFLSSIARQVAISVENVFLHKDLAEKERVKQELEIARRIQLSSLPQVVPVVQGLDISGFSNPALEVGGDFYDFYEDSENEFLLTAAIGDVSGKGTSAALYMSKIQGIMRSLQEFKLSPQKLLIKTNYLIYNYLEKGSFITAACFQINTLSKNLILSRAGHLPLYHFNCKINKVQKHIPKGLVLGMNRNELFDRNLEEYEIKYETGDVFVLVTDGILEARNSSGTDYQEERLLEVIENSGDKSAQDINDEIINSVEKYTGREDQFDDITVMVIKTL